MYWEKQNKENTIGNHGAENTDMYVLALAKYNVDIEENSKKISQEEEIEEKLQSLLTYNKEYKKDLWEKICSMNPHGLFSNPPTIAAVRAKLDVKSMIPSLSIDNKIVDSNYMVHCLKIAVHYTWDFEKLSKRLEINETHLRNTFYAKMKNSDFLDTKKRFYLPNIPGLSIFIFGDIEKLKEDTTEVTVRVHDQCLNSDCFRGTICTCAPYLFWAMDHCIQTAQRGGVGLIFYFKKEGRSMGEVIKFRVYSSRTKNDKCGEYFNRTKNIAGVDDIRFQELMPDPLLWLGIRKIDHLYSMSHLKYNALLHSGIMVKNRHEIPKEYIHHDATTEITAKIQSGYHRGVL